MSLQNLYSVTDGKKNHFLIIIGWNVNQYNHFRKSVKVPSKAKSDTNPLYIFKQNEVRKLMQYQLSSRYAPLYQQTNATLNSHQKIFNLQWIIVNTKTHNQTKCREYVSVECSIRTGASLLQPPPPLPQGLLQKRQGEEDESEV